MTRTIIQNWRNLKQWWTFSGAGSLLLNQEVTRTAEFMIQHKKETMMIPNMFGKILCGLFRQKFYFLEGLSSVIWHKTTAALHNKNIIPTLKHGGGSVVVWRAALLLQDLEDLPQLLSVRPPVHALKLKWTWIMYIWNTQLSVWMTQQTDGFGLKSDGDALV